MRQTNLLVICSDQHNPHIAGFMGNSLACTPNLDRLAARGTVFEHAYTPTPICVPARAAMATGDYPFRGGFWDNAHPFCGDQMSWGRRLEEAGYYVAAVGKLHFKDDSSRTFPGQRIPMNVKGGLGDLMTACRVGNGTTPQLRKQIQAAGEGDSDYIHYDREIAREAVRFLKTEAGSLGRPWCLYAGFTTPHYPLKVPEEFMKQYEPYSQFPLAAEWEDPSGLHPALRNYKRKVQMEKEWLSAEEIKRAEAAYYGLTAFLDSQAGAVLDALREAGLEESTRVLYLADHGDSAGEHGLFFKSTMNEGSVGIPMIAAGPDIPAGRREKRCVSLIDVYPTLLQYAGLERTKEEKGLPGISLSDTIAGNGEAERPIFSEYHCAGFSGSEYMLRKGRWKLVRYTGYDQCQLFDLETDPQEDHDLGGLQEFEEVRAELNRELEAVCDPEELDRRSMEDQKRLIEEKGGLKAVLEKGLTPFTAVPEGMGVK